MLHEILLSLSGHPSPLFDTPKDPTHVTSPISLLSPPETELLSSLGHLSRLHRRTRAHAAKVAATHNSTICRAVATAITSNHLDQFQRLVLDVEARILKQDASTVGAYNIVPLAAIVGEFSAWTKLMEWLWDISTFMAPEAPGKGSEKLASGAALIDKLRNEAQTGYPDIESAALHLGTVAETSWLRQLSIWVLYGRLPAFGSSDFPISRDDDEELAFVMNHSLLPKYVTRQTASSLLFVGKSLNQIRSLSSSSKHVAGSSTSISELDLLPIHVKHLSEVKAPITPSALSTAVSSIRLSLSRNLLQHLLPPEKIVEVLTVLYQFFLLGRGEFATTIISESDSRIQSRHRAPISKPGQGIQGVLLKENEINQTLAKSFSMLAALSSEDDQHDDILGLASSMLHLSVQSSANQRPGTPGRAKESTAGPTISNVVFNDLLLGVPVSLSMDIQSPLDLFLTPASLSVYSSINAYLLSVRRAHLHLSSLWKQSSIRREHPPPPGYAYSNSTHGKAVLKRRRERLGRRGKEMRKVWATCSAGIFFLAECEAYFHGEVVQQSFQHFLGWVEGPDVPDISDQTDDDAALIEEDDYDLKKDTIGTQKTHHDPETLQQFHISFLSALSYSLLLNDIPFTQNLRTFLSHVDALVALITRLQLIWSCLDLEEDEGVEDFVINYKKEEAELTRELDRARRRLDSDMKSLIGRLRDVDGERVGMEGLGGGGEVEFEALRVGGVDRLLMKLDWSGEDDGDGHGDLL